MKFEIQVVWNKKFLNPINQKKPAQTTWEQPDPWSHNEYKTTRPPRSRSRGPGLPGRGRQLKRPKMPLTF
jgi:hypothetical protein